MLVVRNASEDDLDAILALARGIGPGMTTLKPDRDSLKRRLDIVAASFAGECAISDADYLFVLEDLDQQCLCGIAAIKGAVGVNEPFYNYRIATSVHSSPDPMLVNRVQSLHLSHDLSGASELCSLYLHPGYRGGVNGKLLSKSRLLFIAQFPQLFSQKIFAEMRGYQDQDGASPFWESVGRPFFHMDFEDADDRCGMGDRLFIEQLVPRLPLYTHLLSVDARGAIGRTHDETVPARRLLEQEGLGFDGYIDIFDGGPVLQANVRDLRATRASRLQLARVAEGGDDGAAMALVGSTLMQQFRVIAAPADPQAAFAGLSKEGMAALHCDSGALVRVLALSASPATVSGAAGRGLSRLHAREQG